jgi:predicted XRE-type DNA-binding protein
MSEIEVFESSANVFADMGLPDTEEREAKALLSRLTAQIIEARGLTQAEAAQILSAKQPDVSDLVRGKLRGFTLERLFRYLNALHMNVHIEVTPAEEADTAGRVLVASGV